MAETPTPIAKASIRLDPEDKEIMRAIVTQRLKDAQVRHYSQTLDYNIRLANREAIGGQGLTKTITERFTEQLDSQATEALANLQNTKTEIRVLTDELRKLGNE